MYSSRLYTYRDSYVLYIHRQCSYSVPYHTRTLFWYRHTQLTFPPPDGYKIDCTIDGNVEFVHSQYSCILTSQLCQLVFDKIIYKNDIFKLSADLTAK